MSQRYDVCFCLKASDVSHPHKMNHSVSEEHQVHTSASDTLVILLQVHLESFFKPFKRWDLKKKKTIKYTRVKFDKTRELLPKDLKEDIKKNIVGNSQTHNPRA